MEILFQPQETIVEILLMVYMIEEKVDFLQLMKSGNFGTEQVGLGKNQAIL
jgi:hypothetical protein